MYVCMYVRMYAHTHLHMYMYAYTCLREHSVRQRLCRVSINAYVCVSVHTYVRIYMPARAFRATTPPSCKYKRICMRICIYVCTHIYVPARAFRVTTPPSNSCIAHSVTPAVYMHEMCSRKCQVVKTSSKD